MNNQDQIRIVQQAYSSFKSGDLQTLLGLMSDDINWELPQIENVPFSGKRRGKDQVKEFFSTMASVQETVEFNPMEFISQEDKVVALGNYQWKAKESGKQFGGEWAHVFTVRNGKIASFHEYMDTAAAAKAYKKEVMA